MIKLSSAQQEQLRNIGTYLKGVREDQGKAIDEIANQIFIRPALVRAIETADSERLPEPVFVQGFIRRYADYLGLDGRQISQQFESTPVNVLSDHKLVSTGTPKRMNRVTPELANRAVSRPYSGETQPSKGAETIAEVQEDRAAPAVAVAQAPAPVVIEPRRQTNGTWILGLAAIAAGAAGLLWLISQRSPQTASSPESPTSSQPATESETTSVPSTTTEAAAPSEASASTPETTETAASTDAPSAPITFSVTLAGESWLRVITDGDEVYEGILTAGAQQTWTAQTELTVRAGDPGAVLYSFNGAEAVPFGQPGVPSTLTLTPDTDPQALTSQ